MAALDTNILVRWLTQDDAKQCASVARLLARTQRQGQRLYVTVTVMLELEWVLRSRYHFGRAQVSMALNALLDVAELDFQAEPALEQALWLFRQAPARDFADCLHVALAGMAGRGPLLTLDERAARMEGTLLLR